MKKTIAIFCLMAMGQVAGAATYCNVAENTHFKFGPMGQMQSNDVFANFGSISVTVYCSYTGVGAQTVDGSVRQPGATWVRNYTLTSGNNSENIVFYPDGGAKRIYFDFSGSDALIYVYADFPSTPPLPTVYRSVYLQFSDTQNIIPDADANGIPDISYVQQQATNNTAAVYWGGEVLQRKQGIETLAVESGGAASRVECWPSMVELAAAKISQNSKNVSWYCVLYDENKLPLTYRTGSVILQPIIPEWKRSSEQYEVTQ